MVDFKYLKVEDCGQIIICHLSNPPSYTLTGEGVFEINKFLDSLEDKKDLRVLAFTGSGQDVFIKHYEVGELADTAENNVQNKEQKAVDKPKELHGFQVFEM